MVTINLISNPKFENGLASWSKVSSNSATTITTQSTGGIDNSCCIKVNVASGGTQNGIRQSVTLSPGTYTVSFYAKKVSGNADLRAQISFDDKRYTSHSFAAVLGSEYVKVNYSFTIPEPYRQWTQLTLLADGSEGIILLDDVTLMAPLRDSFELKYATVNLTSGLHDGLKVRSDMRDDAKVIGYWPHGRRALVLATEVAEWYECRYRGSVGYVKAAYLTDFKTALDPTAFGKFYETPNRLEEIAEYEVNAATYSLPKFYLKNASGGQEWCHMFADWLSSHNCWAYDATQCFPYESNCRNGVRWFLENAEFHFTDADYKAKVRGFSDFSGLINSDELTVEGREKRVMDGDYVYFASSKANEVARHVAVAISSNTTSITIAEGNIADSSAPNGVRIRTILKSNFDSEGIFGFGNPSRYCYG